MIVQPKVRGFICTTAHPNGLQDALDKDIAYVKKQGKVNAGKFVLVIGASMGYGLSARAVAAFGGKAETLGVIFDRPASGMRTASAGWYNTAAMAKRAKKEGLYFKTINADAFSSECKQKVVETLKADGKKVDCVVYSVAAPRRTMPDGTTAVSVLKTTDKPFTNKTIDLRTRTLGEVTIEPATDAEIAATVDVMGGGDWQDWMKLLEKEGLLSDSAVTVAFSYIGPTLTHAIYKDGSIGRAKADLALTARKLREDGFNAYVSVNKALVTQSSSAIPIVPLYISLLYKVMKKQGLHEGTIEQMQRLFGEKQLLGSVVTDSEKLIRLDDKEMSEPVQKAVSELWQSINESNLFEIADIDGYDSDFLRLFGFGQSGVDYDSDVETEIEIDGLIV